MSSIQQEAKKLGFKLCQTMIESIVYGSNTEAINAFEDLSQSSQREIAMLWLEWKITETGDAAYLIDLLDFEESLNLITSLTQKVDYDMGDCIADKVINGYRDQIEDIFNAQLKVAA